MMTHHDYSNLLRLAVPGPVTSYYVIIMIMIISEARPGRRGAAAAAAGPGLDAGGNLSPRRRSAAAAGRGAYRGSGSGRLILRDY